MDYNRTGLPSKDTLDKISFKSSLNTNLKQLSIQLVNIDIVNTDLLEYSIKLRDIQEINSLNSFRLKSPQSLKMKYEKYLVRGAKANLVFNDLLGIRIMLDTYPTQIPAYFTVVDLRQGKKIDDGYRAMHLYYQKDTSHYQIEIQLWCGSDIAFNTWSHIHIYKYSDPLIGQKLR